MLHALASTHVLSTSNPSNSPSCFPTTARIQVPKATSTSSLPTHVLALYAPLKPSQDTKTQVRLLPTHALVLAAYCAALPALPIGVAEDLETTDDGCTRVTVPIVPMCVPEPETAGLLSAFLYTHDERQLVKALVGIDVAAPPSYDDSESKDEDEADIDTPIHDAILHTSLLLSSTPSSALIHRAKTIAALWRNMCAFGVHDAALWRALETSWAVVVGAVAVAGGRAQEQS